MIAPTIKATRPAYAKRLAPAIVFTIFPLLTSGSDKPPLFSARASSVASSGLIQHASQLRGDDLLLADDPVLGPMQFL